MLQDQLPADSRARHHFDEAYSRIRPFASACLLWERVLSLTEREQLGNDVQAAFRKYGTAGLWMEVRGVSGPRAILDIAHAVNLLSATDYAWLLREIGEPAATIAPTRPHWNAAEGKLCHGNNVIRRVRITKHPANIQNILNAFEAANWVSKISNPLSGGSQQLHQALRSLNSGLKLIRFHSLEGGQAIRWESNSQ